MHVALHWPSYLEIRVTDDSADVAWGHAADVDWELNETTMLDFDKADRCCGLEIWPLRTAGEASRAGQGLADLTIEMSHQEALHPAEMERIARWQQSLRLIGGENVSLHWLSADRYDYSDELEEAESEYERRYLRVGRQAQGLVAGYRFLDPRESVSGFAERRGKSVSIRGQLSALRGRWR